MVSGWAEELLCPGGTRCGNGECENLHLYDKDREREVVLPPGGGKLVICAGPERSGSTWLFNAVRLMLQASGQRTHSYWLHTVTAAKLAARRGDGRCHVIVKTHEWSDAWDPATADLIFLTEREECDVVNSYLRAGWLPHSLPYLKQYMEGYLDGHLAWRSIAHAVVPFGDLVDVGGREVAWLGCLADLMGVSAAVDCAAVSRDVKNLPIPSWGGPDPVSKLWPKHIGGADEPRKRSLSGSEREALQAHVAEYLASRK